MDMNNWRPTQGGDRAMNSFDWRAHLHADSRQRIVNKIMETLKRHLPFSGQAALQELKKISERFEEKIFTEATSQSDYLRKISLKMLTMETKPQNTMPNSMQSNSAGEVENPPDPDATMVNPRRVDARRTYLDELASELSVELSSGTVFDPPDCGGCSSI